MKLLFNLCENNNSSNTGRNIKYLLNTYNLGSLEELISERQSIKIRRVYPLEEDEHWKPVLIEELCMTKLGFLDCLLEKQVIEITNFYIRDRLIYFLGSLTLGPSSPIYQLRKSFLSI